MISVLTFIRDICHPEGWWRGSQGCVPIYDPDDHSFKKKWEIYVVNCMWEDKSIIVATCNVFIKNLVHIVQIITQLKKFFQPQYSLT